MHVHAMAPPLRRQLTSSLEVTLDISDSMHNMVADVVAADTRRRADSTHRAHMDTLCVVHDMLDCVAEQHSIYPVRTSHVCLHNGIL